MARRGRNSTFPLVDRIFDGKLEPTLKRWQAEGASYQTMAFLMREQKQVVVDPATVSRWFKSFEPEVEVA